MLGVDPGSHHLGYGVIEWRGSRLHHVVSGTLSAKPGPFATRMAGIIVALEAICEAYAPSQFAIETAFAGHNVHSALLLGQARGAVLVSLARRGLCGHEYAPSVVKLAAVGHGNADKQQVQAMVRLLLGLRGEAMAFDTSDALAIAICHAQRARSSFVELELGRRRGAAPHESIAASSLPAPPAQTGLRPGTPPCDQPKVSP